MSTLEIKDLHVEVAAEGAPAVNTTVVLETASPTVAVIVLSSAFVEASVPEVRPLASVGAAGCSSTFALPLAVSITV